MPDWGFADVGTLSNATWGAFLKHQHTLQLQGFSEQGKYLKLIEEMVKDSANYNGAVDEETGLTDFQTLEGELANAESMFCGGIDCMDEEAKVSGKMVGLLNQAYNTNKMIYQVNVDAQNFLVGDPDNPGDFGLTGKIRTIQGNVMKGEGTDGAIGVLQDMATQYKNWSKFAKKGTADMYEKSYKSLLEWIQAQEVIGGGDLDPDSPLLELGDARTNPVLSSVGRYLAIGETEKAYTAYNEYLKTGNQIRKDDYDIFRRNLKKSGSEFYDKVQELKSLEITGNADPRFMNHVRYKYTEPTWQKEVTTDMMASRQNDIADNIAGLMDAFAEGNAAVNWGRMKNEAVVALKADFKLAYPQIAEYTPTEDEIGRVAVKKYFGGMGESQVRNLAVGSTGIFGDEGMDFPGWEMGDIGEESSAEDYFVKQFQLYKIADDAVTQGALLSLPGQTQQGHLPSSKKNSNPLNMKRSNASTSFIDKSTGIITTNNNLIWDHVEPSRRRNIIAIDPAFNTPENANNIDIMLQAYNGAMMGQRDPNKAILEASEAFLADEVDFNIQSWESNGEKRTALIIGNSAYIDSIGAQVKQELSPSDTTNFAPIDSSAVNMDDPVLQALDEFEQFTDAVDFGGEKQTEFADNTILDSLSEDAKDMFVNSADSSMFRQQIDEEMNALFGEQGLNEAAMDIINTQDGTSSSDVLAKYLNNRDDIMVNCPECGEDPFLLANYFIENFMLTSGQ